ncbi:DoxX family membrane protein [Rufibacter soli]
MLTYKDFLLLLTRLFLGYVFFSAGVCKLTHGQFGQLIGPPWLEERLAQYGLGFFAQVVACCQVIIGALLFTQRFSTLGAIMLVPMNIAILAVTVSQHWTGTPYVNAVFLLLNLLLLLYEYPRFQFLFSPIASSQVPPSPLEAFREGPWPWAVLAAALATLVVAPFSATFALVFGLVTFLLAGLPLLRGSLLSTLEKTIVLMAIGNMCLLTIGMKLPYTHKFIAAISALLFVLLLVNLWLKNRSHSNGLAPTA